VVDAGHAIVASELAISNPRLVAVDPVLLRHPHLLALDAVGVVYALRPLSEPLLLAFHALRALGPLREPLLLALDMLERTLLHARLALGESAPAAAMALERLRALASAPATAVALERLGALATATATVLNLLSGLSAASAAAVATARLGTGRGSDRQRGDARGEKNPGHHGKTPFEREQRTRRRAVPASVG